MFKRSGGECRGRAAASALGALCLVGAAASVGGSSGPAANPALLLAIGDSLVHGTMDARNNEQNTLNAFVQRVADSLGQVVDLSFAQPLYDDAENRIDPYQVPSNYGVDGADLFSAEGLEYYSRVGAGESYLTDDYLADETQPATFSDDYDKVLFPINVYAGKPTSQIDALIWALSRNAEQAQPWDVGVLFWLGNNDSSLAALGAGGKNPGYLSIPYGAIRSRLSLEVRLLVDFAVLTGELSFAPYTAAAIDRNLTSAEDFRGQLSHLLRRVAGEKTPGNGRERLFLMSLPYYSAVGYLFDSEDLEFYLRKLDAAYQVPPTFARVAPAGEPITDPLAGDRVSLLTFAMMYAMLSTGFSVDDVNAILEQGGQQMDGLVMSEAEQQQIMGRIDEFNASIVAAAGAAEPRVRLIDTGAYLNARLSGEDPLVIGDRTLGRKWVRGNAFSLDGVHPGYTGQALIANYVLEQMGSAVGLSPPLEDLEAVLATDPYVDNDGDGWAPGPATSATGVTELMFLFRDPDDGDPAAEPIVPSNVWDMISDLILDELLAIDSVRAEAVRLGIDVNR